MQTPLTIAVTIVATAVTEIKDRINNNDRIAQMILTPVIKVDLEETSELPDSIRGVGGFGSTGK